MKNDASSVLWRRLLYMLTPQLDIYEHLREVVVGANVLEVGFGTGFGLVQYVSHAASVDAVEIDQSAVEFARRSLPFRTVKWIHDDWVNPSRPYIGYDVVIMIEVLEHIEAWRRALNNVKAALQPGGVAIITVPNSLRYRRRVEPLNVQEWAPEAFLHTLKEFFSNVSLLGSDLLPRFLVGHQESPIIARVQHGR